jgi:hypothetical protein
MNQEWHQPEVESSEKITSDAPNAHTTSTSRRRGWFLLPWTVAILGFIGGFRQIIPAIERYIHPAGGMVRALDSLIPYGFLTAIFCGTACLVVLLRPKASPFPLFWRAAAAGVLAASAGAGSMLSLWILSS